MNAVGPDSTLAIGRRQLRLGAPSVEQKPKDVLRPLGTDLDGPDITRQLLAPLSTVRTHTTVGRLSLEPKNLLHK